MSDQAATRPRRAAAARSTGPDPAAQGAVRQDTERQDTERQDTERQDPAPATDHGKDGSFRSDQLVVTLTHADAVVRELQTWSRAAAALQRNPVLRLALVELDAAETVGAMERDARTTAWVHDARLASEADGYESSDLDVAMRVLQRSFADRYAGWVPTMGKNRILDRVQPSYVIDGGGSTGHPEPVANRYVIDGGGLTPDPEPTGRVRHVPSRRGSPGRGARVGIIDSQLAAHPWLTGAYVAAAPDLLSPREEGVDSPAHATFVTGLVLRQAPGAVVEVHRGLWQDGRQDSWSVAVAISELAGRGIDVINLSLGCFTDDDRPPLVLSSALQALGPGVLVVAAAGNHGRPPAGAGKQGAPKPWWPAAFDSVVAVGALDGMGADATPAEFSPDAPWVDAMAPGVDVVSTYQDLARGGSGFGRWSGTSFSAAVVTGAVAAATRPGQVSARDAWQRMRGSAGRPFVGLRTCAGWPSDGRSTP